MQDFVKEYEGKTPTSRKLYEEARELMPGGVSHGLRYFSPYPLFIQRVEGPRIWDVDGNEYIDLWMGHYAGILGHRPSVVVEAIKEAVELGTHWGIVHEREISLARLIREMVPCVERLRFCVSGTEATMYAVRLARAFTGRRVILKMEGGWHGGNTDLSAAIKAPFDQPESAGILSEISPFIRAIPLNDSEAARSAIRECGKDLAGIIIEPVMGAGGMIPSDKAYLETLREETTRVGAVLIFDEIITGFRLAPGGGQEYYGVVPDLVVLGKIVGGGSNIGVIGGKKEIFDLTDPTIPRKKGEGVMAGGGTFSCSPMTMVTGLAMLGHLKEHTQEIYPRLNALGERLRQGMEAACEKTGLLGRSIGAGSLSAFYLPLDPGTRVRSAGDMQIRTDIQRIDHEFRLRMLNHGVYTVHGGGAVSMAHTEEDVDRIIQTVEIVAREML
jgi:glutamate-1-semialdehyde 2,1-aminomutase